MQKYFLLLIFILSTIISMAQVQWAEEFVGVSSAYTDNSNNYAYKAIQALGSPSSLPNGKVSSVVAWSPSNENNGMEYIHVKFSHPQKACQLIVNESFNPGTIVRIELFDLSGKSCLVKEDSLGFKAASQTSPLTVHFPLTSVEISSVKITLNTKLVPGFNNIDAIGITSETKPVEIKINEIISTGEIYQKERLQSTVNTRTDELLPVISPDGETIYFVRDKHPMNVNLTTQHIWYAAIDQNGMASEAVYMAQPINNSENNAICSVTPDGQKLLLLNRYLPDGKMEKGVSIATKEGDNWGFPQAVNIDDFYNESIYGEYALLNDGKTMVITTQRKDGFGNKDVQVTFLKEDGSWTAPKNLGPTINTAASETSPFVASDGKTLYFASRGHLGYGSSDLYMSTRLDDSWTNWSEPLNLGSSINTPNFDAYYTIPAKGDYAYFINYSDTSSGDIYRIKLPSSAKPKPVSLIKGHVYDAETKLPLESKIAYESLQSGKEIGIANSNIKDGFYSIVLPGGDYYGFQASVANYYPVSQNLDLRKLKEYESKEMDLFLYPIKVGQKVKLNNVFFDTGKFSFRKETYVELNRLVAFLASNPTTVIRIDGHTDNQGEDATNLVLSKNRAKAVYDYLILKGIKAEQLSYKGFGETSPVDVNTSESGRQNNRRVEFLIEKL